MRLKLLPLDWLLVFVIAILAISFLIQFKCNYAGPDSIITGTIDSANGPLNDSLPYYQYKRIADSIEHEHLPGWQATNDIGYSWQVFSLGFSRIESKKNDAGNEPKYFLRLGGYRLRANTSFGTIGDQWLIRTAVWDSIDEQYHHGHLEAKPVNVRFVEEPGTSNQKGDVLVPISKQKFRLVQIATLILFVLVLAFGYYLLALTWRIIMNISRNKSFSESTYRNFFIIGLAVFLSPLVPVLIALITKLVTGDRVPSQIYYPVIENLLADRGLFCAGLIIITLGRAFRQGYKIQKENESYV
jgi:hypothetical protein